METVLGAFVTGVLAIIGILVEKGRRENKRDHGNVVGKLTEMDREIRKDLRMVRYELNAHRDDLKNHIREDH
jgi:hypothetical protein